MSTLESAGWRAPILEQFSEASAAAGRVTVVRDPDRVLAEPGIVRTLQERGFELLVLEDPVVFRFAYESRFRERWDRGEAAHLVAVVRREQGNLHSVPYDLLKEAHASGRILSFSFSDLFPALAPNVLAELDYGHLDALARAVNAVAPEKLGTNATLDFVLRHVFEIAPELIKTSADLIRVLLRRHYRAWGFPEILDERFIELLGKNPDWRQWPLERIVPGRDAFLAFLAERWPHFLISQGYPAAAGRAPALPSLPGPIELPFDHEDIRVYIDNLFVEGLLEPTTAIDADSVKGKWFRVGVAGNVVEDACTRLERLVETVAKTLPEPSADHVAWSQFAARWAEATSLRWRIDIDVPTDLTAKMNALHDELEARFALWMQTRYASIHSLPHLPTPPTLDKVARYLAHHRDQNGAPKVALIVVDGLAMDQWLILRETLDDLVLREAQIFAWVPTLTAVSRQAIFAGEPPYLFAQSIGTTQKESQHWSRYWDDQGIRGRAVAYVSQRESEDDAVFNARVLEAAEHSQCKVLGVVVGRVDEMMHGVVTGMGGMHSSVRQWARQGHFRSLVKNLLSLGFDVFVTADHGNIEATGMGRPNVGAIAETRGERVFVFSNVHTRSNVHKDFPGSIAWSTIGLPNEYLPLLPPGRRAFIHQGKRTVGHGGISIEEVIVPFVRIMEAT